MALNMTPHHEANGQHTRPHVRRQSRIPIAYRYLIGTALGSALTLAGARYQHSDDIENTAVMRVLHDYVLDDLHKVLAEAETRICGHIGRINTLSVGDTVRLEEDLYPLYLELIHREVELDGATIFPDDMKKGYMTEASVRTSFLKGVHLEQLALEQVRELRLRLEELLRTLRGIRVVLETLGVPEKPEDIPAPMEPQLPPKLPEPGPPQEEGPAPQGPKHSRPLDDEPGQVLPA